MLINSIINEDKVAFKEHFETLMSEKLSQAIDVLSIIEAKKLLLGKEKEDDEDDDEKDVKEDHSLRPKNMNDIGRRDTRYNEAGVVLKGRSDGKYDKSDLKRRKEYLKLKSSVGKSTPYTPSKAKLKEDELDEAGLLLKSNKRSRKADKQLQRGAIRGDSVSTLKGYRAKTKYHNMDTVNRFRTKSGQAPLGKTSEIRDKKNAIKARNPKRLPEEEVNEVSKYQKDPEVTKYISGKGKTPAKLERDHGLGVSSFSDMRQRNTRENNKLRDGQSNKREMKANLSGNKAKAEYHSTTSFKRYKKEN